MFDDVPTRVWLLLLIALIAFAPARYLYHHVMQAPSRRDITQPSVDLSWRTTRHFSLCLVALLVLLGLAFFIFTPAAEQFAASPSFWPIVVTGLTGFCLYTLIDGLIKGAMEPILKGDFGPYQRHNQPRKYWASLVWNIAFTGLMAWMAFNVWTNPDWIW